MWKYTMICERESLITSVPKDGNDKVTGRCGMERKKYIECGSGGAGILLKVDV